jgi:hypothetical protein
MANERNDAEEARRSAQVRTMQIVAAALMLGVAAFAAVVVFVARGPERPAEEPIVSILAALVFGLNGALSFVVPGFITEKAMRSIVAGQWTPPRDADPATFGTDANKLLAVGQIAMIVRFALLESCAFFGLIAYLVEGQALVLAVPAAAVLLMLMQFPTRARVESRLETQTARLSELRQDARMAS